MIPISNSCQHCKFFWLVTCFAQSMDSDDILPEEVWGVTLEKLRGTDAYNGAQVCATFENYLQPWRTRTLFSEVFPLLEHKYIRFNDALSCRRVCRQWKSSVDAYWQSVVFCLNQRRKRDHPELVHFFEHINHVQYFMEIYRNHPPHVNPFITRDIRFRNYFSIELLPPNLDNGDIEVARRLWTGMEAILEKFGRHVWYCTIHIIQTIPLPELYLRVLHRFLSLMPNLRGLVVGVPNDMFFNPPEAIWEAELVQLRQLIQDQPLPALANLVSLELDNFPRELSHELLRVASESGKMRRFAIENYKDANRGDCSNAEIASTLTGLEVLQMYSRRNTATLLDFRITAWPLQKVELSFQLGPEQTPEVITISNAFEALSAFGATLKELQLGFGGEVNYDGTGDLRNLRLRLPVLRSLIMRFFSDTLVLTSVDFAEEMKELRLFQFLRPGGFPSLPNDRNPEHVIQVCGLFDDMRLSNIWQALPKLVEFSWFDGHGDRDTCRRNGDAIEYWNGD